VHGHRREEIDRAIISQVQRISHSTLLGISSVPAILLAKKMADIAPLGLSRIFYSDDGSTAVEIALKIAFQYWQQKKPARKRKHTFISLDNAYHGDTIGAVSVGGIDTFTSSINRCSFPPSGSLPLLLPLQPGPELSLLRT